MNLLHSTLKGNTLTGDTTTENDLQGTSPREDATDKANIFLDFFKQWYCILQINLSWRIVFL